MASGGFGKADTRSKGGEEVDHGDVVIAAITSCTNTSNPGVMVAAGLVAKKAVERGLRAKPWVKTSLTPGSTVVSRYLDATGLQPYLDTLGFNVAGYSCGTCVGASGPIDATLEKSIMDKDVIACAVLSGNRNFEARIHPAVRASFLASPPLVVAFALAGRVDIDLDNEPLGTTTKDEAGLPARRLADRGRAAGGARRRRESRVLSRDLFGGHRNTQPAVERHPAGDGRDVSVGERRRATSRSRRSSRKRCGNRRCATSRARGRSRSSATRSPPTTSARSAASRARRRPGLYLQKLGVAPADFNNYGARRMNHEVMMRGTFANVRLKNLMVPGVEGGVTEHQPSGEQMSIYDAAMRYAAERVPLVVIAGEEYGTGSARDWAAKGTRLLGVRAVVADSFERIHRSNLVGMGVLPCQLAGGHGGGDAQARRHRDVRPRRA